MISSRTDFMNGHSFYEINHSHCFYHLSRFIVDQRNGAEDFYCLYFYSRITSSMTPPPRTVSSRVKDNSLPGRDGILRLLKHDFQFITFPGDRTKGGLFPVTDFCFCLSGKRFDQKIQIPAIRPDPRTSSLPPTMT